jgi:hypothetical protein
VRELTLFNTVITVSTGNPTRAYNAARRAAEIALATGRHTGAFVGGVREV